MYLSLTDLILLCLVQALITAVCVLMGLWLRDIIQDRKLNSAELPIEDSWLDDSHVDEMYTMQVVDIPWGDWDLPY